VLYVQGVLLRLSSAAVLLLPPLLLPLLALSVSVSAAVPCPWWLCTKPTSRHRAVLGVRVDSATVPWVGQPCG